MAFMNRDMGCTFHEYFSILSIMTGWITEMLFMLFFFAYIAVQWTEHS